MTTERQATWKDRLIAERTELRDRLDKLKGFIASTGFDPLDMENRFLLCQQELAMETYEKILTRRIHINEAHKG